MSDQKALAGGADAQQSLLASQTNLFLFDLKNEATEHGFKANDTWFLDVATQQEILLLKKDHHPVISLRLQAGDLLKVFRQVKNQLNQPLTTTELELTANDLMNNEKTLLVAYPVNNPRK